MLHWTHDDTRQMFSRRSCLRAGFLALGGLGLAELLRQEAQAGPEVKRDKSVILLFVHGGPSHLETYDMKPAAPVEVRGPFLPIPTNVRGIDVCEHLPLHAKIANRFSLIRSCAHDEADHFAGHRRFLSGYGKLKAGTGYESHHPQVGAVVNRLLPKQATGIPTALAVGGVVVNGPDYSAGISEGFWNSMYRVPIVNGGLPDSSLSLETSRFDARISLQRSFDQARRDLDQSRTMEAMDAFQRQAVDILTTGRVQAAFDLSKEDPKLVEAYGDGYGREALLARRLVEAGVRFVSVRATGSGPGTAAYDWDDHAVNWDLRTAMLARLPRYDRVVTTLISDLYDRGLDRDVLLIVTGEFGRTPRLEFKDGRIGRDHWPGAMSILLSGGGIKTGQVLGSTDRTGSQPESHRLDPHDILATIYHFLGLDPKQQIVDSFGRPISLAYGTPVKELW